MSLLLTVLTLFFIHTTSATYSGLWWWTWSSSTSPGNTNLNIAFSGWTNPDSALSDSGNILSRLQGEKYLSLGGGNSNGRWTAADLTKITSYCTSKRFSGYNGISFDIEEGDSGLTTSFKNAFSACKAAGYKVLVTVSHSTPYGISDAAVVLMPAIIADPNVDILSPQLYTQGTETSNDYTANGVAWASYKNFKGTGGIVPSVVSLSYCADVSKTANLGQYFNINGCIQWSQSAGGNPPPPPPPPPGSNTIRCGTSWAAASASCGNTCVDNSQCSSGTYCYNNLASCTSTTTTTGSTTTGSTGMSTVRCGSSWTQANSVCGAACVDDKGCTGGLKCWADLSKVPCGGAAQADVTAQSGDASLTEFQVGLIVFGCLLFVALVAVVAVLVVRKKRVVESV